MKTYIMYHDYGSHRCMDGAVAATIAYRKLSERIRSRIKGLAAHEELPEGMRPILVPCIYKKAPTLSLNSFSGAEVYFVDFVYQDEHESVMHDIARVAKKVVVIDHHPGGIKTAEGLKYPNVEVWCTTDFSGAGLTAIYFNPNVEKHLAGPHLPTENLEELLLAYIANDYDTYKHEYPNIMALYHFFFYMANKRPDKSVVAITESFESHVIYLEERALEVGKALYETSQFNAQALWKGRIDIASIPFSIVFNKDSALVPSLSEIARKEGRILLNLNPRVRLNEELVNEVFYSVSFRGYDGCGVDLDAYARKCYKGGGHPNAAGGEMTQQQLSDLLNHF